MDKVELRKKYKELRSKLSFDDVSIQSAEIVARISKLNIWHYNNYHVFMSIKEQKEIDTTGIIELIKSKNKNVIISSSNIKTKEMTHYVLDENTLIEKSKYNIPEPVKGNIIKASEIDVLFIPLLAYSEKGARVGYGAGFYDIFLKNCKTDALKIGLSFFPPERNIEVENHDIPLDACITPTSLNIFNPQIKL